MGARQERVLPASPLRRGARLQLHQRHACSLAPAGRALPAQSNDVGRLAFSASELLQPNLVYFRARSLALLEGLSTRAWRCSPFPRVAGRLSNARAGLQPMSSPQTNRVEQRGSAWQTAGKESNTENLELYLLVHRTPRAVSKREHVCASILGRRPPARRQLLAAEPNANAGIWLGSVTVL